MRAHVRGETRVNMVSIHTPAGYEGVEYDDGTVHAVDLSDWLDDGPLWRAEPVCGSAETRPGDEAGHLATHRSEVTCWECVSIIS
jgi:hypothetical protein